MVYNTLQKQKRQLEEMKPVHVFSASDLFRMFRCSSSGYYAWASRYENHTQTAREKRDEEIMEKMREVIRKHYYVPGSRMFAAWLWRDCAICVNRKHAARLMKKMGLKAYKPKKDAYKGQATHFHPCDAKQNLIERNFGEKPRQVILTDITYLYCLGHTVFYLCAFKDGYTREILGWSVSRRMDVSLVLDAYQAMMKAHGSELHHPEVYIHSDQGSQYLSTTFQQILKDDDLIQSVSRRGNSQDNAPMESFFGKMKCQILSLVELCPDYETAVRLISGFMYAYNNEQYQYSLAGLTPVEFYKYQTTGIYPLDNYYGVKATELKPVKTLVEEHMKKLEEKRKKQIQRKENAEKKLQPLHIIATDQKKLHKEIRKTQTIIDDANEQIKVLTDLLNRVKKAAKAYAEADEPLREKLTDPMAWRETPPFDYVTEMKAIY